MDKLKKNIDLLISGKVIKDIHKIVSQEEEKEKQEKYWSVIVSVLIVIIVMVIVFLKIIN